MIFRGINVIKSKFVTTGDLVMPLFTASLDIRLVRVEDAFLTGYCARRVGGVRKASVCVVLFFLLDS